MSGWQKGYNSGVPYVTGYIDIQAPVALDLVCAVNGIAWSRPDRGVYAELGCGRGYTAATIAAANPDWDVVGIDYDPGMIAEARGFAAEAGLDNLRFLELDLAELGEAEAVRLLPEFDIVTAHGVWAWVGDAVRDGIVRLLRARLRAGGLAQLSYNALPGAAGGFAVQRLFKTAFDQDREGGSVGDRLRRALDFVRRLRATGAVHLKEGNEWANRLLEDERRSPNYLAHEMLTDHWRPALPEQVAEAMAGAKLDYAGSSHMVTNFPEYALTEAQRAVLAACPPGATRELIKGFCLPHGFRSDVFVRGARSVAREAAIDRILIAPLCDPGPAPVYSFTTPLGDITLDGAPAAAIGAALRTGPRSIAELRRLAPGVDPARLLLALIGGNRTMPAWRRSATAADMDYARRFNLAAARRHPAGNPALGLLGIASPIIGAGIPCPDWALAMTAAWLEGGNPDPAAFAATAVPPDASAEDRALYVREIGDRVACLPALGVRPAAA